VDDGEVDEEIIQAAEQAAEVARSVRTVFVAAEAAQSEINGQMTTIGEMTQMLADYPLGQIRETLQAVSSHQMGQIRETLQAVSSHQMGQIREPLQAIPNYQTAPAREPLLMALNYQAAQIRETLVAVRPTLLATQQWADINRRVAEMTTVTVLPPVAQNPASAPPATITAAPQTPARRDEQVIPPWLWLVALMTVSFTVSAAEKRLLSSDAQATVGNMITWFSVLLAIYALRGDGKR
jgi:hypothetical protein